VADNDEGEGHSGVSPRAQLIEVATKIFCAGMSFSGPYHYTAEEAVGSAIELLEQVDKRLDPPAG
jgi:hypothetical protein